MNHISFAAVGNELLHQMRDRINNSEDINDLKNNFSYTMTKLLHRVFEGSEIILDNDSIVFDPQKEKYFQIKPKLHKNMEFESFWENSDIFSVVEKFALATYKRYMHLKKNPQKTKLKIRK